LHSVVSFLVSFLILDAHGDGIFPYYKIRGGAATQRADSSFPEALLHFKARIIYTSMFDIGEMMMAPSII